MHRAFGRHPVPTMGVDDSITSNLSKPQMKRHDRVVQISRQTPIGLYQYVLQHIAHVDPFLNLLIQSHPD